MLLRGMIEALDAAADGDARAVSRFVQSAEEYTKLLQAHIRKEEHCLFPDVLRMLKPLHHEALLAAYRRIENQVGSDTREKLIRSADALAERLGAPRVRESTGATCGCGTDDGKTAQILPVLKPGGGTADSEQPFERPFIPSGI
jgi:hypothetical protein